MNNGKSAIRSTRQATVARFTGPQYVHTFRVYPKPDPDDEPWPESATITRAVKRHICEWCGRRSTTNQDRICDVCRPEWEFQRKRMAKGDYPMEKGTA